MKRDLKSITILFRAQNHLQEIIKENIASFHLTPTEFGVLEALYHKQALTVQEVRSKVLIAPSSLSYVVEQLLKKGRIKKAQCETDKRVFYLSLSEEGVAFMEQVYPQHEKQLRKLLDVLSPEEETILQNLLKKIGKADSFISK